MKSFLLAVTVVGIVLAVLFGAVALGNLKQSQPSAAQRCADLGWPKWTHHGGEPYCLRTVQGTEHIRKLADLLREAAQPKTPNTAGTPRPSYHARI